MAFAVKQSIAGAIYPFFFAPEGVESDDRLVDVVRGDPAGGVQRVRAIALFNTVCNVIGGGACAAFLLVSWDSSKVCGLRWWFLVYTCLQLAQLPGRGVLLLSVLHTGADTGEAIANRVASLTAASAWRLSKKVVTVQHAWFALGMVWWLLAGGRYSSCPSVSKLFGLLGLLYALRATFVLASFRDKIAQALRPLFEPLSLAAAPDQIAALPEEHYSVETHGAGCCCSICLCDFDEGDAMTILPCRHHFHPECVGQWLKKSKRCPLCVQAIDSADGAKQDDAAAVQAEV